MSDAKVQKKMRIMLPEEVQELIESHDDLLEGLVLDIDTRHDETEGRKPMVRIAFEGDETVHEEGENEEEYQDDGDTGTVEDDTPNADFFDAKDDEELAENFGTIEGMAEVAEDEENEFSAESRRLSVYAQNFVSDLGEIKRSSSAKIVTLDAELEKEEDKVDETRKSKVSREDSSLRIQRLSRMLSMDHSAKRISIAIMAKLREASRSIDSSRLLPRDSSASYAQPIPDDHRNIYYDFHPKHDSEEDIMQFFDLDTNDKFVLPDYCEIEEEVEDVVSVMEEEPEPLDRAAYHQRYDECMGKIDKNRIKNNILQKKVAIYLKRRKVKYFLKETTTFHLDQLFKYHDKLNAYQHVLELDSTQRKSMTDELSIIKQKNVESKVRLEKLFKTMQTRQGNVGYGLIFTKTGTVVKDTVVERLLKRQRDQLKQVSTMRLKYIRLKDMVQEKLDSIEKADHLENNLRLADYEQLKVDNRNYYDKIEEREEELVRLRTKCQNTIQVLAHMREKLEALESDKFDLEGTLNLAADTADHHRSSLGTTKHQRDKYRKLIVDMKMDSGLLIHTDLLMDMKVAENDIVGVMEELECCKQEFKTKATHIRNLRKRIELLTEIQDKRKKIKGNSSRMTATPTSVVVKSSRSNTMAKNGPMVYKGHPSLVIPVIKLDVLKDLMTIRPNPKTINRRR